MAYFPSRDAPELQEYLTAGQNPYFGELFAAMINESVTPLTVEVYHTQYEISDRTVFEHSNFMRATVLKWAREMEKPLFRKYTQYNAEEFKNSTLPVGFYFFKLNHIEEDWVNRQIAPVAQKDKGRMLFTYVDHKENPRLTEVNGIRVQDMPGFAILQDYPSPYGRAKAHYAYAPDEMHPHPTIAADEIDAFIADFLDGKIPLKIRSQELDPNNVTNVTRVTGETFESIVLNSSADVIVRFTAEFSERCFHHTHEWTHLANETVGTPNFTIADFDASKNDFPPQYIIEDYPTVWLFKHDNKTHPIPFTQFEDYPAHVAFLRKHIPQLVYHEQPFPPRPLTEEERKKLEDDQRHAQYEEERAERKAKKKELRAQYFEDKKLREAHKRRDEGNEL